MRICGYCIMGKHWHLLLWPREDGDDTFRIKIWEENGGELVVYDNEHIRKI